MMRLIPFILLAGLLWLAGCPQSGENTQNQPAADQSVDSPSDATETANPAGNEASDTVAGAAGEREAVEDGPPAEFVMPELELDSFKLGMSIDEARGLLGPGVADTIQEQWRYEGLTGMIIAGTYEEPTKMMGSLIFLNGELVGVISNRIQEPQEFEAMFNGMLAHFGPTLAQTPEWVEGHRFMQEMQADERQPHRRYLWADEQSQSILIAAYDESVVLATYMLINAEKYDDAARAMAEIGQ